MENERKQQRFAEIVLPHLSDAFSLARWISGSHADAEDITQEACLRAFHSLESFRGDSARAWILAIVRNTAASWLSKHRSAKIVSLDGLDLESRFAAESEASLSKTDVVTPEASLIARADATAIEQAIAELPGAFREVVVLRDIQGLSYHEIAEVTGIALGTVMSRLARGRRRLLHALSQQKDQ